MDATRAGMGCGSCKAMVTEIVEWACGGQTEEDPSVHYYVPGVPLTKPQLIQAIREQNLRSVSAVFAMLADGREDAASKPGLASLLKTLWKGEYDDEKDARFINERVHANIQKDGTFSVVPQIPGGVTSSGSVAADRRRGREVSRPAGEADGRTAHRFAWHPQRRFAQRLARSGHAIRLRVRQELPHVQELRGYGFLPLRNRRQHGAGHQDREASSKASTARTR